MNTERMNTETEVKISYIDWLLHSVDGHFYFSLRHVSQKRIIKYLVVTCLIAVTAIGIGFGRYYYRLMGDIAEVYDKYFPPMEIDAGTLIVSGKEPVVYSGEGFQIIVDTKHEDVELDSLYEQGILFLKDKVVFIRKGFDPREIPYRNFRLENFNITPEIIRDSRGMVAFSSVVVFCVILTIQWLLTKTIAVLVGAMVVGLIAGFSKVVLSGRYRSVIAMTAMVPAIFIETTSKFLIQSDFFTMVFPEKQLNFEWLHILVHGVFLYIGTRGFIKPYLKEFTAGR